MATSYRILIRCPKIGDILETGMKFRSREALNGSMLRDASVPCRLCGENHSVRRDGSVRVEPVPGREGIWRPNP